MENYETLPESRNIAPTKLELLITIVELNRAVYYTNLIQSFDVNLQISTLAKGTAQTEILHYLGLTASQKTAIFSIVREDKLQDLMQTLDEKFHSVRGGKGVAVSIPFTSVIGTMIYGFLSNDKRTVRNENESTFSP